MKKIWGCRRSSLGLVAIICLTGLGFYLGQDITGIATAITGIVASVAGSNAYEKAKRPPTKE